MPGGMCKGICTGKEFQRLTISLKTNCFTPVIKFRCCIGGVVVAGVVVVVVGVVVSGVVNGVVGVIVVGVGVDG